MFLLFVLYSKSVLKPLLSDEMPESSIIKWFSRSSPIHGNDKIIQLEAELGKSQTAKFTIRISNDNTSNVMAFNNIDSNYRETKETDGSFLTINAVDGSVIDRYLGY